MYKQDIAFNKYAKYTMKELLLIFTAEALSISKKPEVVRSIAESALKDFIKYHTKYIRFV